MAGPALLRGRGREMSELAGLVADVRSGQSRVLVVRGEAGMGKTALLDYLTGQATDCQVVRVAGMQSEMEFAFAGLHQLLPPMLAHLERLPAPQREALRTAFGISTGPAPERFIVALAVLGLLSETAAERPLICVIDDEQWLDQASAQALGFVARRLAADPVGLVFAARVPGEELTGLPGLLLKGLAKGDAQALLDSALTGPLDPRVRDRIVAEADGNPLALLELPRGMTPAELAGGFGLPGGAASLTDRIEDGFRRRLDALPDRTKQLLLLAAADPSGDPALVWRAAGRLGLPVQTTAVPAAEAGLADFGAQVRFRHPLVRSVAYLSAPFKERQQVHEVLAEATDPADPDRRAWHRAQAASGPDEEVAAELAASAGRAQARGGLAAAAAFLERAVRLTADPARLVARTLAAAEASVRAGTFDKALELLVMTEAWPLDELASARVDLLRARIAFATGVDSDAPSLLLRAAQRLQPLNLSVARETYLDGWGAALAIGHLAADDMAEISRAARALPRSPDPGPAELLLDGLARLITDGLAAAAPALRRAVSAFASGGISAGDALRWGWLASVPPLLLWDDDGWRTIVSGQVRLTRDAGALENLPIHLQSAGIVTAWSGTFGAAAALIAESEAICEATGAQIPSYASLVLAGLRGRPAEAVPLIEDMVSAAEAAGQGLTVTEARWVAAVLHNGLGRYNEAREAAWQAAADPSGLYVSSWALPELIEAAVRSGNMPMANAALARLAEATQPGGTEHGLGIQARSRALVSAGAAAEGLYREAIDRLGRTQLRPEIARARLLYGEWLRRENRRAEAREQLRTACDMFDEIGMQGFAGRSRREMRAAGETVRKPTTPDADEASQQLTARERQVALLARDGLSNPEIGARLFISAHTVQYHLGKVFTKLGIASRGQLYLALPDGADAPGS